MQASLALIRSVNPNMHRHHTARATDNKREDGWQRGGWKGGRGWDGYTERGKMKRNGSNA